MKNIKLTEEHKSKLLEMCKKLFPEYPYWKFGSMKIAADYELWFYDKYDKNYKIHWFEFVMTHLITKLYNISHLKDESSIKQLRGYVCQDVDHPVDYLYEEFKKL